MRHIGVLGGTFDPIHKGHLYVAGGALNAGGLDSVLLLPCGNPPNRTPVASAADRFRMAQLAAAGADGITVSDTDMREGMCCAWDTLQLLSLEYPDALFSYIIGSDKLSGLSGWYNADELFRRCDFLVYPRTGSDENADVPGARIRILPRTPFHASSGMAVLSLRGYSDTPELLHPDVAEYIALRGLYRPDFTRVLHRSMGEKRYRHTLGVRDTAVRLARLHGACMQRAAVASLLHDCAKPLSLSVLQTVARKYRLTDDPVILESEALLHGPVGAQIAKTQYGISDEAVLSAIRCHTTGRPGMTALDLCVFVADAIEPGRKDYPGLSEIRELARTDLKAAALRSMECSREYVLDRGQKFSDLTLLAMNELSAKER